MTEVIAPNTKTIFTTSCEFLLPGDMQFAEESSLYVIR